MKINKKISIYAACGILAVGVMAGTVIYADNVADKAMIEKENAADNTANNTASGHAESKETEEKEKAKANSEMKYLQADASGKLKADTTDTEVPVTVDVTYYLEDKEISPEEIAGKSGKVTIRFDYENLAVREVKVGKETISTHVPFMMMSAVVLPADTFSNIKITNGKIMEDEDQNIAVGIAFPSLSESLELTKLDMEETIKLPDYVEITADVTEFELDFTANVIAPIGLGDIGDEEFEDMNEVIESISDLGEASETLADGTGDLLDGLETFQAGISSYTEGTKQLETGIHAINTALAGISMPDEAAMDTVAEAASSLTEDASALGKAMTDVSSGMTELKTFVTQVNDYKKALKQAFGKSDAYLENAKKDVEAADETATQQARSQAKNEMEMVINNSQLTKEEKDEILQFINYENINISGATADARQDIINAQTQLTSIPELDISDLTFDVQEITTILSDMEEHLNVLGKFSSGMSGIADSITTLTTELKNLETGAEQLTSNNSKILEGVNSLVEGTNELYDGMKKFDKEGIQKIKKTAGENLETLVKNVKALKQAEQEYKNTETNYIIETESIDIDLAE
ncbi:MAG: hypothetical protein EOM40_13075 [Clostridia bacterium]|nr:hypothetical protein [Clostridia bacterium]NCC44652.1 hypothetical protein [Clostridia bacterium]